MEQAKRDLLSGLNRFRIALGLAAHDSAEPERGRLFALSKKASRIGEAVTQLGLNDYPRAIARLAGAQQWLERGRGEENCRQIEAALTLIDPGSEAEG